MSSRLAAAQWAKKLLAIERPGVYTDEIQVNEYLAAVQAIIDEFNGHPSSTDKPYIILFPKQVAFRTQKTGRKNLASINRLSEGTETEQETKEHAFDYGNIKQVAENGTWKKGPIHNRPVYNFAMLLSLPPHGFEQALSGGWLRNFENEGLSEIELEKLHQQRQLSWHAYGVQFADGNYDIYDPSYERPNTERQPTPDKAFGKRRMLDLPGMSVAKHLYRQLDSKIATDGKKGRWKVGPIRYGGGGNDGEGICRDMTCQWLVGEIIYLMGGPEKYRVQVKEWEPIKK